MAKAKVPPQKVNERLVSAFVDRICSPLDRIADALQEWVTLQQRRYEKEFPEPRDINPVSVGKARYASDEDIAPELQGDIFPEEVGPREKKAIAREERKARELARSQKKPSR